MSTPTPTPTQVDVPIDKAVLESPFLQEKADKPLRVCCYGSSSSLTPVKYLSPAKSVGYILAKRGHTCVNGAGSFGCMAAMNDGAGEGDGHIVGVIHEMWLVESEGVRGVRDQERRTLRDGGAHSVFDGANGNNGTSGSSNSEREGPKREMLVAGGKDLQERKRLLVDKADALIVLPGGPGTWDELWEMACARNLGLTKLPIVCVNVDGFYDPFRLMLQRAWEEKLTKLQPSDIVHFENTAEDAVKWIEAVQGGKGPSTTLQKRKEALRSASILTPPVLGRSDSSVSSTLMRSISNVSEYVVENKKFFWAWAASGALFGAGMAAGAMLAGQQTRARQ
jgi:uncharacterized protein (TIGR00730 family)